VIINTTNDKKFEEVILQKFLLTFIVLLFIRLGTFIPVPGVNHNDLMFYLERHSFTKTFVSTFSGDNSFALGLFTLNIIPYINASIFIQLLVNIFPNLKKLQREGGVSGRRTINRLTRSLTLLFAIIQSTSIAFYLKRILFDWNLYLGFEVILWLTAGAMIVLWMSELVTDYGLGNGASLLIYINIISNFPNLLKAIIADNLSFSLNILILIAFLFSLCGIVLLQRGVRKISLISSRELNKLSSNYSNRVDNYLPLSLNQSGVMPIILTTAVLVIPGYINNLGILPQLNFPMISQISKFIYWIVYFVLIVQLNSFYSTIILNPKDISNDLQKMGVAVSGVRPGIETTFYLSRNMERMTLLGSIILAILATGPNLIEMIFNISSLNGFSVTSFLIVGGVILDIFREIRSIYYSTIYNKMY